MEQSNKKYFFDEPAFDLHDGGYVPLIVNNAPEMPLNIPPILKADRESKNDIYYTVTAKSGKSQILPGEKTQTWGYNANFLGKTIIFHRGQKNHITLKNDLPELTTFHWHGADVSGPYVDGGCHAPVYPGEIKHINFTLNQPAATLWLHAHPCPSTAEQVWQGLATMVIVQDEHESQLSIPRNYGVDDIPIILQDRHFHKDNQFDYRADYDPDGVAGPTAVINGTVNPYFDVTTQKIRLRFLNGANRREWRLHFSDDLPFDQIAGDCSLLPKPIKLTGLMLGCAERAEVIIDFSQYHEDDEVTLYTDQVPLLKFRIHNFAKDTTKIPDHLINLKKPSVETSLPIRHVVMQGMDESVAIDDKKFAMERIDAEQIVGEYQYWDVTNSNEKPGMVHPFHIHGTRFLVLTRNGKDPYPNENGFKDTIGVNPGETVRILVKFDLPGIYMYHCHILEHEDGGMMAQIEIVDPKKPHQKYQLMDMNTLMNALAEERGIELSNLWMAGMESYEKMGMKM